ncbi:MAG: polymorphic toxin-type HINT domain-containing protein [Phycisphaerales bacterium JB054]
MLSSALRRGIAIAAAFIAATTHTHAQGPTCEDNALYAPSLPDPGSGDPCAAESKVIINANGAFEWVTTGDGSAFASPGWHNLVYPYAGNGTLVPVDLPWFDSQGNPVPTGYRLGVNLLSFPTPGTFLPPGENLADHSSCLLPAGAAGKGTSWQGTGRPTLHNRIDLVTGLPLIQVTDLELPVGGSTFRLRRTRSGTREDNWFGGANDLYQPSAPDNWWDWTGMGWMASENPLLLIDSSLPDVVGDQPLTCYLVLDAHHSIPFQLIESSTGARFEAPPRFRARMEHNGTRTAVSDGHNNQLRVWDPAPTQYDIYLYDGELHYTFVAVREDVPPNRWDADYFYDDNSPWEDSSYNDRPFLPQQFPDQDLRRDSHAPYASSQNRGFGIPYFGLCTRVADRHGNTVEIEYCGVRSSKMDDADTSGCIECQRRTLTKGQIKYIKLKSASGTAWTLVYAHRLFEGMKHLDELDPALPAHHDDRTQNLPDESYGMLWVNDYPENQPPNDEFYNLHGHIAIDRIYVFEGDVSDALLAPSDACLTISHLDTDALADNGVEPLDAYNQAHSGQELPDDWEFQVRYYYDEDPATGQPLSPPLLIRTAVTTVHSRDAGGQVTASSQRNRVYQHQLDANGYSDWWFGSDWATGWGDKEYWAVPWIRYIFEDEQLHVLEAIWDDPNEGPGIPGGFDLNAIGRARRADTDAVYQSAHFEALAPWADFELRATWSGWDWPSSGSFEAPGYSDLFAQLPNGSQYVTLDKSYVKNDNSYQMVAMVSLTDESGARRHYRLNRVARMPIAHGANGGNMCPDFEVGSGGYLNSHRSVFAQPFYWQTFFPAGESSSTPSLIEAPELHLARWVAIVDEFSDRDDMTSNSYGGSYATKAGQLSRRVVEMNPTGFVLRDKIWEYDDGGAMVSGGGLGEQFIYKTAEQYFADEGDPLPSEGDPETDPYAAVRDELLLVEHRSVGWSAAERDGTEDSQGLVRFFDYKAFVDPNLEFDDVPAIARIQGSAEGIQRGIGTSVTQYYTKQVIRDPDRPNDVLAEIEFTSPVTSNGLLSTLPPLTGAPPAGQTIRRYETEWVPDPDRPDTDEVISKRLVVGPPKQVSPSSGWYYPVEVEFYDTDGDGVGDGSSTWSATGQLLDPLSPNFSSTDPYEALIFTYYQRDSEGRSEFTVIDATPGQHSLPRDPNESMTVGSWPADGDLVVWERIGLSAAANAITEFDYDKKIGLENVYTPNRRRWARRILTLTDPFDPTKQFAREYIFNDLYLDNDSQDLGTNTGLYAGSPGEVNDYNGEEAIGSPTIRRRVVFDDPLTLPSGSNEPTYTEYWKIQMALDANGRPQQAELLEPAPGGGYLALGTKEFNDLGEVTREQELDGTITRLTKNALGFVLRRYIGTTDEGWTDVEDNDPDPRPYNMILVERAQYGDGEKDAWLPTIARQYRSDPTWSEEHHGTVTSGTDTDGFATITSYDWRMRPVRIDTYAKGDPENALPPDRLSTTLTFLDHVDRPRLVVTFGAGSLTLGTLDPTELSTAQSIPAARDFYNLSLEPTSIMEMFYGPDGQMTERRTYDKAWTYGAGDPPYLAEYQYGGQGGKQVYAQRPGQPISINRLDSFGRVSQALTVRPDVTGSGIEYELERTDYVFDGDGNISQTLRYVRTEPAGDVLTATGGSPNAVRTRTVSWYDKQKRLIATADLGTEDPANQWIASDLDASFNFDSGTPPTWDDMTYTVTPPADLPAYAQLWFYVYDVYGNQTHVVDPMGLVTEHEYTLTGRLKKKIENAGAANPDEQRVTEYAHQYGRVVTLKAQRTVDNGGNVGEIQNSHVDYGAEVVDESFTVVSGHNGLVASLEFLGTADPLSGGDPDVELRYTFGGQVAERIDKRGVSFRYAYDDLGRVESIEIGNYDGGPWAAGYPASMTAPNGQNAADRVGFVEYLYDDEGNLSEVKTYDEGGGFLITHNRYDYDDRANLVEDWQAQGSPIDTQTTPHTGYSWEYVATDPLLDEIGYSRVTGLTYPTHDGSTARAVTLGYGAADSTDDLLSRIASVTTNFGTPTIADFEYVGVGRREATSLALGEISQTYRTSTDAGLASLDRFGRAAALRFTDSLLATLFEADYTYDANGNRVTSRLTQADGNGGWQDNVRSQVNAYDGLNRMVGTDVGALLWNGNIPSIDPNTLTRSDQWGLDLLGNWTGSALAGTTDIGRSSFGNLDGYGTPYVLPGADSTDDTWSLTHEVTPKNAISNIEQIDEDAQSTLQDHDPIYDGAGNLIFDGNYYFQYDAWNRLVQVNNATPDGMGGVTMGSLRKHFMYDGLGRLVRTQTPFPSESRLRTERFYYDGLRRIQELVTNPITTLGGASGDPELEALASQTVAPESNPDEATAPSGYEQGQLTLGGSGGAVGVVEREYVWGPGDNGFDELLVQYDKFGNEAWAIQDAGGDLVAMCDLGGANGMARVVGQWTFDAYGEVLTAEFFESFAEPHLGHKGIFLARLDASATSPRLVPFAHGVYHMRNRAYVPQLGRFLQRDPNQTALALVEATAMHGRGLGAVSLAFDLEGLYGDGGNLYEYLGSNPWMRSDPLGLSWDPFDMVDEYLAESTGARTAFLNQLGQDAKAIAIVGATIASYLPVPIVGSLGDMALYALGEQTGEELAVGLAIGMIPGGKLLGGLGKFLGKIGGSAWSAAKHYAGKFGRGVLRSAGEKALALGERALEFVRRKPSAACGCFTAATLVWTPAGAVPIDQITEGAIVLAAPDNSVAPVLEAGEVSHQIVIGEASLLRLTVRRPDGSTETINTTDEHPFHLAESIEWVRADLLQPGRVLSAVRGEVTVICLAFTADRVPVYNLSVPGSPTYLVGESGLWVHNCGGFVDNLGRHVLDRHGDSFRVIFNGRVPYLDEIRPVLMDVAEWGEPLGTAVQHATGWGQDFVKRIDGHDVVARVFYDNKTGKSFVQNGWVLP